MADGDQEERDRLQRAIDTLMGDATNVEYDAESRTVTLTTSHRGICRALGVATRFPQLATIPVQDRGVA